MLEYFWKTCIESVPSWVCFGIYPVVCQILTFWIFNSPFVIYQVARRRLVDGHPTHWIIVKYLNFMNQFLINPKHSPLDSKLYLKIVKQVWKIHIFIGLPVSILMGTFFPPPFSRSYQDLQTESLVSQLLKIPIYILCDDIFTFIVHYQLHKIPFVYKYVHCIHHEIKYTVSIASQYFHPIEFLVTVPAVMSGPLLTGSHLFWSFVWTAIKTCEAIHSHSGFDFLKNFRTNASNQILLDAGEHTYHHSHYQDCYGAWWCLSDKIFGTNVNYLKFQQKLNEKEN